MKKFLDFLIFLFCIGTLFNTCDLIFSNLQLILFLLGWWILFLITLVLMSKSKLFDLKEYKKPEFLKKKDPQIKIDQEIEKNLKDPKN